MKTSLLLLLLLWLNQPTSAQIRVFDLAQQCSTRQDVRKMVDKIAPGQWWEAHDSLMVAYGDTAVLFKFNCEDLYYMQYKHSYLDKSYLYNKYMDYMLYCHYVPVDFYEDENQRRVISTRNGVVCRSEENKKYQIFFCSFKWVNLAPLSDLEGDYWDWWYEDEDE